MQTFPTTEAAERYAQEQADQTRARWVWYTDNKGKHVAEKADVKHLVQLNDIALEGDMVIIQKYAEGPIKHVAYPADPKPFKPRPGVPAFSYAFDIATEIVSEKPFDQLTQKELVDALRARLDSLVPEEGLEPFECFDEFEVDVPPYTPTLRCTWCGKDTPTAPCEHCDNSSVTDRTAPHRPEWSRHTMQEVECKVCDRRGPYSIQASPDWCDERNNPDIIGIHENNPV